ncbi:hypothetical protein [Hydrogenophaga sp.]|uniref:hypothetical protein n=3 Tax=Hydrogenophaga sp. TaxID=1904254 RepID=UPI00262467F6|nr:hypothetical protein [Hydrogenophaga sp.]
MFSIDGFSGHAVGALQRAAQYKLPNKRGHSSPQKQLFSNASDGFVPHCVSQNKSLRDPLLLSVLDFRVSVFVWPSGSVDAAIRPTPRTKSWFFVQPLGTAGSAVARAVRQISRLPSPCGP